MKRIIRVTDQSYRKHIQGQADGRLPLAWLTFGNISGHGWGLRWGFWPKFKNELLDPYIVTHDPGEDW